MDSRFGFLCKSFMAAWSIPSTAATGGGATQDTGMLELNPSVAGKRFRTCEQPVTASRFPADLD